MEVGETPDTHTHRRTDMAVKKKEDSPQSH